MELKHFQRLRLQDLQQVAAVVRYLDQPVHAVGGTRRRRKELVPGPRIEHPLGLEPHPRLQASLGHPLDHPPRERPLATRVWPALLGAPVHGSPRPTRLGREYDQAIEVGEQPQVADWPGRARAGGDRVVEHEHVEHRRHPDSVAGGVLESRHRHGLYPRDPAVVDIRRRDADDTVAGQLGRTFRCVHPATTLPRRRRAFHLNRGPKRHARAVIPVATTAQPASAGRASEPAAAPVRATVGGRGPAADRRIGRGLGVARAPAPHRRGESRLWERPAAVAAGAARRLRRRLSRNRTGRATDHRGRGSSARTPWPSRARGTAARGG